VKAFVTTFLKLLRLTWRLFYETEYNIFSWLSQSNILQNNYGALSDLCVF
jgi:hypothetical protein